VTLSPPRADPGDSFEAEDLLWSKTGGRAGRVLSPKIQPGGGRDVAARMRNFILRSATPPPRPQNARARALPVSNKRTSYERIVIGIQARLVLRSLFSSYSVPSSYHAQSNATEARVLVIVEP